MLRQLEYQLEQACVEDERGHLDVAMGMYSQAVEAALQDVREQQLKQLTCMLLLKCRPLPSLFPTFVFSLPLFVPPSLPSTPPSTSFPIPPLPSPLSLPPSLPLLPPTLSSHPILSLSPSL